jgi:anthranilate phosphoribosyltransferase
MKHAGPVRAELKMRTVFNMLGPLTNPAGAGAQVVGVFDGRLARLLGEALLRLGVTRAFVVHGADGLDEISTAGPTLLVEVNEAGVAERTVQPADFGLPEADAKNLEGGDRDENAAILRAILGGETGPRRDIVLANASAALVAAGVAADFRTGVLRAEESIDSGAALAKLERFLEFTRESKVPGGP